MKLFDTGFTLGVLGGGQLGRMMIQSGIDLNVPFRVLDPDPAAPCSSISNFTCGKLTDYDTVMAFGKDCDVITIEIENVNTRALKDLETAGKLVYPQPDIIAMIQDKRLQKEFYRTHGIPTADFILTSTKDDVVTHKQFLPAVHKLGREGYDGRGVQVLRSEEDLGKAFDAPGVLEQLVPFEKEIAVIVARSSTGEVVTYPAVEMVFHPVQNLVEFLFAPADLTEEVEKNAQLIAKDIITKLEMVGLLAVEMFVNHDGSVLVNEIAPRPHNSGHQTIEGNITSQYEQHLRAILGLPLGDTAIRQPSAMINLLGEPGYNGAARYEGLDKILQMTGAHIHLYGKQITKPLRKMGHITILDNDQQRLKEKARFAKETLKVIS